MCYNAEAIIIGIFVIFSAIPTAMYQCEISKFKKISEIEQMRGNE